MKTNITINIIDAMIEDTTKHYDDYEYEQFAKGYLQALNDVKRNVLSFAEKESLC